MGDLRKVKRLGYLRKVDASLEREATIMTQGVKGSQHFKLRWIVRRKAVYSYQRFDCYADTDGGRWSISGVGGKDKHYTLRFDGKLVKRFQTVLECKEYAELGRPLGGLPKSSA